MNVFFELHRGLPREAPGSDASTARALCLLPAHLSAPGVLDIGCGPGGQTLVLAGAFRGSVTAVDNHLPYLRDLGRRAEASGHRSRIRPVLASMLHLPFRDGAFDLIWSEGAIDIIGFERGLREWRRLLRPGGFLAVSEVSWLKPEPPPEVRDFWRAAYPGLKTVEQNIAAVRACGYDLVGHFVLPEADWWDSYYGPLAERLSVLQEKYGEDPEVLAVLEQESVEITLFRRYPSTYGYVFFVMKRGREGVPED